MMSMKAGSAGALALAIVAFAGSAQAQMTETKQIIVTTADLDLRQPEGRSRLTTRIRHAVNRVCPDLYVRDLAMKAQARECRTKAFAEAELAVAKLPKMQMALAQEAR